MKLSGGKADPTVAARARKRTRCLRIKLASKPPASVVNNSDPRNARPDRRPRRRGANDEQIRLRKRLLLNAPARKLLKSALDTTASSRVVFCVSLICPTLR